MIGNALLEAERAGLILQDILEEPGPAERGEPNRKDRKRGGRGRLAVKPIDPGLLHYFRSWKVLAKRAVKYSAAQGQLQLQ
jgi:hypothetical protein